MLILQSAEAQFFLLSQFFRSGVRVGYEGILPSQANDTLGFGLHRGYCSFIVPISGSANLDLKKLDASFNQNFLNINTGFRSPQTELLKNNPASVYNFTLGFTRVYAGLGKGMWFYTANVGMVQETELLDKAHPFFIGAAAFVRIKGLRKHNIYGLAVTYNYGRVLPVPIFGLNRKLGKKTDLALLLPIQAEIKMQPAKKLSMSVSLGLSSFQAGALPNMSIAQILPNKSYSIAHTFVKTALSAEYRFSGRFKMYGEVGTALLRSLSLATKGEDAISTTLPTGMVVGIGCKIDFTKSPISSQLFGNDM